MFGQERTQLRFELLSHVEFDFLLEHFL